MDLFDTHKEKLLSSNSPLADRMRPRTLDEYIGQEHIIGEGRLLRRAIQIDQLSSVIFYGPPGTGKTTLARIIANTTKARFISINAVLAGVKDIREAIDNAHKTLSLYQQRTILFIDEVHRFNKSQQDALLPHVENGVIILIGATTENPYFEVNKALVSRSRIFQLKVLNENDLRNVAMQALSDKERGYGKRSVEIDDDALDHLVSVANGDARGVLNALQLAVETTEKDDNGLIRITRPIAEESIQQRAVLYDRDGDAHYDTISAFIKSMRGSDPDAALYWMAKMVYAGEDPRFIFRRMLIFACEDIGMADPDALAVVVNAAKAFDYVGLPEGRFHLSQACIYCATAPKSNSNMAFFDALSTVSESASDDVPDHLKDPSRDKEELGHGANYLYPHAYKDHWVAQQYLPDHLQGKVFYQPSELGYEKQIKNRVEQFREAQLEAMIDDEQSGVLDGGSSGKKSSGMWTERTLGSRGKLLQEVRTRMMELASIERSDLVLDLHSRTGLLSFEAARKVNEGAVWAVVYDTREYQTVSSMASRLDQLSRPVPVRSQPDSLVKNVINEAGENVAFDVILGRNVLRSMQDKHGYLENVASLLAKEGRIVLSEIVPSMGQRISELASDFCKGEMYDRLLEAERALFEDETDPMVNWTADTLKKDLSSLDRFDVSNFTFTEKTFRRIIPREIDHWFRATSGDERPSLGDRLTQHFTVEEKEQLRQLLHKKLDFKDVQWKTTVMFMKIQQKGG
ncbi:MAG: AAA family ATPase, partial [Chitinispirillaceae bacterium]